MEHAKNTAETRKRISYLVYSGLFLRAINDKHPSEAVKSYAGSAKVSAARIASLRNMTKERAAAYNYTIKDVNSIIRKYILHSAVLQKVTEADKALLNSRYPESQSYYNFEFAINILGLTIIEPELKKDKKISRTFIGYIRNISKQYIDLVGLTLSFDSDDILDGGLATKGTCEYRIYSQKNYHNNHVGSKKPKNIYTSQSGSFNYIGENLTALINANTPTSLFETYLSIHAPGFLATSDDEDEIVMTGFYTTVFSNHSPGRGLIMLEQKTSIDLVEESINLIFKERLDYNNHNPGILKDFYKDSYIKFFIQHALYKHTPILTDKETIRELPDKDKLVTAIAPRTGKGFDGYYQFQYLDVNRKELISNIVYIDNSGKSYMHTFQKSFYFGFFQIPEKRVNVATLHFDYLPQNRVYRINIVISIFNVYDDALGYLYGVYSAMEHGNDLPVCGRMRLTKLSCNSLAEAEEKYPTGITSFDLRVLKNKTTETQEGAEHDLWMFLEGKWPPNGAFGESLYFHEALLKDQEIDITSGKLIDSRLER